MKIWHRRILGVLAAGGGYVGLSLGTEQLFALEWVGKILVIPFMALYAWGIWCGIKMIEGTSSSLRTNRLFWACQIPVFSSPLISYMFASGALLNMAFHPADLRFSFDMRLGSQFGYSLMQDQSWAVGINFFALCMYWYLTWCLRREPFA